MKKNDVILIAAILFIAIGALIYLNVYKKAGDLVIVKVDGQVVKELPMNEAKTITVEGVNGSTNVLEIKDNHADIIEASCPDKLCVHQKEIQKEGETLVCLPNKVVIEIKSKTKSDIDAVAKIGPTYISKKNGFLNAILSYWDNSF